MVIADIPGIIQGASSGAGLGIRFLKHISRTRLLLVLIDLCEPKFLLVFDQLMEELRGYGGSLAEKRRIILGTKTDIPPNLDNLAKLRRRLRRETVIGISAVTGAGLDRLRLILEAEADPQP
jgi:GTP-binding protein